MANNLRRIRDTLKLRLVDVAPRVGVSPVSLHRWEVGKVSPKLESLERLAAIYGVSVADLVCDDYVPCVKKLEIVP